MSESFRYEPVACIRIEGGDVYHLPSAPTDPRKLANRVGELVIADRSVVQFIEAYDTRGNMHLINTNYIIDIYVDEKAYLKKEESK